MNNHNIFPFTVISYPGKRMLAEHMQIYTHTMIIHKIPIAFFTNCINCLFKHRFISVLNSTSTKKMLF